MNAGPMNGSKRARPRFLLFPERISDAALSVLLNSVGAGLSFAMIDVFYNKIAFTFPVF
jgi:hypothetical protein